MINFTTGVGILLYPKLFKSEEVVIDGIPKIDPKTKEVEKRYSVTIVFPKQSEAAKDFLRAVKAEAEEFFNGKIPETFKSPLKDGDKNIDKKTGQIKEHFAGMYYIQSAMKDNGINRPKVVDLGNQDIINPEEMYGGSQGRIAGTIMAYAMGGGKGVSFWLNCVQKTKDGKRIGGNRLSVEEAFGAPIAKSSEDPANYAASVTDKKSDPFEGL